MCPIALLREPKGGENPGQTCLGPPKVETHAMQDIVVHLAASKFLYCLYFIFDEQNKVEGDE